MLKYLNSLVLTPPITNKLMKILHTTGLLAAAIILILVVIKFVPIPDKCSKFPNTEGCNCTKYNITTKTCLVNAATVWSYKDKEVLRITTYSEENPDKCMSMDDQCIQCFLKANEPNRIFSRYDEIDYDIQTREEIIKKECLEAE